MAGALSRLTVFLETRSGLPRVSRPMTATPAEVASSIEMHGLVSARVDQRFGLLVLDLFSRMLLAEQRPTTERTAAKVIATGFFMNR